MISSGAETNHINSGSVQINTPCTRLDCNYTHSMMGELWNGNKWGETKLMTNNNNGMITDVQIAGNTLDEVQSIKYLGEIISEERSKPELLARIAQSTASLSSLKIAWRDRNITLRSRIRLIRSLVISIFLDTHRRPSTQNTCNGDEMLLNTPQHIVCRARQK